jgi:methylenetetrahydrofolate--tRNA-(uracil-5-)-methyltransferase
MVGFQTKLKYGDQAEVLRQIPGLQDAKFARLGGIHRNTFLNAPRLLDATLRLKAMPRLRFAGQITGCEGYVESAAIGALTGLFCAAERAGDPLRTPPPTTATGALVAYITGGHLSDGAGATRSFQPMNVNFGLFPPVEFASRVDGRRLRGKDKGRAKKRALTARALSDFEAWLAEIGANGAARLSA